MPGEKLLRLDPNEKQKLFFTARARYIAYGGARGGGKSWAVRSKAALLGLYYPGVRILIVRRSFAELEENHIRPLRGLLAGVALWRDRDKTFEFPNGSRIRFGYCDNEGDVLRYQGQEYDVVFLDEAGQLQKAWIDAINACVRGTNGLPKPKVKEKPPRKRRCRITLSISKCRTGRVRAWLSAIISAR